MLYVSYHNNYFIFKELGAGEIAQPCKLLALQAQEPELVPQNSHEEKKKSKIKNARQGGTHSYHPSAREVETDGSLQLAGQPA